MSDQLGKMDRHDGPFYIQNSHPRSSQKWFISDPRSSKQTPNLEIEDRQAAFRTDRRFLGCKWDTLDPSKIGFSLLHRLAGAPILR